MRVRMNMEFSTVEVERLVRLGAERGWLVKDANRAWSELETPSNIAHVVSQLAREQITSEEAVKEPELV